MALLASIYIFSAGMGFARGTMAVTYGKISLDLPAGWMIQSVDNSTTLRLIIYSPEEINDNFLENMNISVGEMEKKQKKDDYISALKEQLLSLYEQYEIVADDSSSLTAVVSFNGTILKQYFRFIVRKRLVYCVTATALPETYDTWIKTFLQIIDSIEIK